MSDERDDNKAKVRRGGKTIPTAHMPRPLPQWAIERLERHMDELYFNPPMPEKYRARYEGGEEGDTP